ncbi:alpha/beta hydrolase [Mycolicibacterium baixiangningiae]|uniref:alpha/beta hydrolase n=1 Tax=Mycolicibacterium baixiangningiae TaxID=2761578 RepID=UPI001E402CC1|nr:alpha/beta hydrolase [Mycolicibacterium baixiangningiae]
MPVTIPQVEASNPDSLTQSGTALGQSASGLNDRIHQQQSTLNALKSSWQGSGSDAAIAKATPTVQQMQQMHESMTKLQSTLQEGGATLTQTRNNVLQTADQLRNQGWQVGADGSVSVRPGSPLDKYAKTSQVNAMQVQQLAVTNSTTMKTLLASFDTTDRQIGQNLRSAVAALDAKPSTSWAGIGDIPQKPPDTGPRIPQDKSPDEVKKWWESLSQADKDRLLREQPDKVGNLNGIPVEDRSKANIEVMNRDIARVENATEAVPYDDMQRYYNALKVRDGLAAQHAKTGAETYLYVYEPNAFNNQGRAAIAIGNPDKADNTAVVVPGTGNSVESGWLSQDDAARVYDQTSKADPTRSTAVVAWMGYDAPDSMADIRVGQPDLARQGGDLLAADVNALSVTNQGDSHVTVMGHSYGSTTVADAAAGSGMRVDDVVLIGSPGTDLAQSAADFHLPEGGHVYVGAASSDPVTHLGGNQSTIPGTDITVGLGNDPADDDFGSTRFKAEVPGLTNPISDHSTYLQPGSESLYSIATIASGHGNMLEDLGMTADHRFQIGIPGLPEMGPEIDPEIFRPGTSGHTYG